MKFLNKIITDVLDKNPDLAGFTFVLPGKRPVVFMKKILQEKQYSGFLPDFITIEDLIQNLSGAQVLKNVSLWLFAYDVYQQLNLVPKDDFSGFLKWFPTMQKDWDDMLKFTPNDELVLDYMVDEERIKDWAQNLGDDEQVPRKKFLNFWKNMKIFLPNLKNELLQKNLATPGLMHQLASSRIEEFAKNSKNTLVFCGFNALTPVEEKIIKSLLQLDKALVYFQADSYYMDDERQEAGQFLRSYKNWKEFNDYRPLHWIENDFAKEKSITTYEVAGNISQSKLLPNLLQKLSENDPQLTDTAVVLLDENLLPASIDALSNVEYINITMGFPLKNLAFSNAMKQLFHLQKQLEKNKNSYYYHDVFSVIESLPNSDEDAAIVLSFKNFVESKNLFYIKQNLLHEKLQHLSYWKLLNSFTEIPSLLDALINFCTEAKNTVTDDILYENISHFENTFKLILNQIEPYKFPITLETLEILINQIVSTETIDFQGEPLRGLQVMGLLETRLLNFKNIILLSVNEGKLPLGNSQNTYLPFDVRAHFNLHTFLVNDSVYAYHFYRLLQGADHVSLLYNALGSGMNTGEKSRFITQIQLESQHNIDHIVIENSSEPKNDKPIEIEKTEKVLDVLQDWKKRVSATHLTSYLYNPIDFYLHKVLNTSQEVEIEEELSVRNYGNLIHFSLQKLYDGLVGKYLSENDISELLHSIDDAMEESILRLNHLPEFYEKGMNFIHKSMARKVIADIVNYDLDLVKNGNHLKIIKLEGKFENIPFPIHAENEEEDNIFFYGFIDRIDELNGEIRIIDYKTAKPQKLSLNIKEEAIEHFFFSDSYKQALQLCIYNYVAYQMPEFINKKIINGIWSFAEVNSGVVPLEFNSNTLEDAMVSIRNLIREIMNPSVKFIEKKHFYFD